MSDKIPKPNDEEEDFEIINNKKKVIENFEHLDEQKEVLGNYNYTNYKDFEYTYQDSEEEVELIENDISIDHDLPIYDNKNLHPYLVEKKEEKEEKNELKEYVEMVQNNTQKDNTKSNKILLGFCFLVVLYLIFCNIN